MPFSSTLTQHFPFLRAVFLSERLPALYLDYSFTPLWVQSGTAVNTQFACWCVNERHRNKHQTLPNDSAPTKKWLRQTSRVNTRIFSPQSASINQQSRRRQELRVTHFTSPSTAASIYITDITVQGQSPGENPQDLMNETFTQHYTHLLLTVFIQAPENPQGPTCGGRK